MTAATYAAEGFKARVEELTELDTMVGTGACRADVILRGIAYAIAEGCTTASEAFEVALMVATGTPRSEAVKLVNGDAHDQRTKDAVRRAGFLVDLVRADAPVSTVHGLTTGDRVTVNGRTVTVTDLQPGGPGELHVTFEPELGDLIEAEYRDSQADYDDGPGHQDHDEDDDQDTEADA